MLQKMHEEQNKVALWIEEKSRSNIWRSWPTGGQLVVVAGCCRMLQDVAGCCRMLQDVAGCCRMLQDVGHDP